MSNQTRLRISWTNMMQRCYNPNNPRYASYGGRGIYVCGEWHIYRMFEEWALAFGYKDTLTIDRINNNEGYSPQNCRWSTYKENNNNKRSNRMCLEAFGEIKNSIDWSKDCRCVVSRRTLERRINSNWLAELAITTDGWVRQ
jgi:hypothetical protein